jgi:hypothetical protein
MPSCPAASSKVVLAVAATPEALEPLGRSAQLAPRRFPGLERLSPITSGMGKPRSAGEGGTGKLPMYALVEEQLWPVAGSRGGRTIVVDAKLLPVVANRATSSAAARAPILVRGVVRIPPSGLLRIELSLLIG